MDSSIKSLKNVIKAVGIVLCLASLSVGAKTQNRQQNTILATSYLVKDLDTGEIITEKNQDEVRSIASITKLMTAIVVLDAKQDLNEKIEFFKHKGTSSRIPNGTKLTRSEIMLLALMSSDNSAAALLAHQYPGGIDAAISAMNAKAVQLNMHNTRFSDPTGLFSNNVSTANDLVKLATAAYEYDIIKDFSTKSNEKIEIPGKKKSYFINFHTTNSLVVTTSNVLLSKTGWIQLSGGCLLMIVREQGQRLAVILLNSRNTHTRIKDGILLTEYNHVRNNRNPRQLYTRSPNFK
jgi:D-alanyl-D-alanine endopeptidase (penicillin-binding protein 7)